MKFIITLLNLLIIHFFINCKPSTDSMKELINRSSIEEIDLYLVPKKYNIMEASWFLKRGESNFDKAQLEGFLKRYNRTIEDVKKIPDIQYTEQNNIVKLNVGKTSHYTHYDYDRKIPILFYGNKWFYKGVYKEAIHQQHINPTLSKILGTRNPNGVITRPISNIIKSGKKPPAIVVFVVLDQGGQQLYEAHPDVPTNINLLKSQSAYFPNAEVGHLDAETGPGHAAIGTGSYPSASSIIGNIKFSMEDGKLIERHVYGSKEDAVQPEELLTETLADVVDESNKNESIVISQCYASRAAIGMGGHGSYKLTEGSFQPDKDFIYWLDSNTGNWITEEKYFAKPEPLKNMNVLEKFNSFYPNGFRGLQQLNQEELKKNWREVMSSPSEVNMELEAFLSSIQQQILTPFKHLDGKTDLAYITFKATDSAGHIHGWESLEVRETFQAVDLAIGKLFDFLQKNYLDNFILVLTADHGCAPLPEISGGKRLVIDTVFQAANSLLEPNSKDNLINYMTLGQVSLNRKLMVEKNIKIEDVINKISSLEVDGERFFEKIYTKEELKK